MAGRNQPSVDNSRQLGLYPNGGAAPQQPLSGPHVQSPQAYYQAVGASQAPPAQPMSAPHPSHAGHSDNRQSGSRYASNPTREAIAQLIEGSGGKELRSRSNSAGSMSDRSVASYDPSGPASVNDEQSWDSVGSFRRPTSVSSASGRSGVASSVGSALSQPSSDSMREQGSSVNGQLQGALRPRAYGGDDAIRDQLPLELRSFGAPPEYAEVMRSPPSSQPGSGVHLGAERFRRASEVAQPPSYSTPAHLRAPLSHGDEAALAVMMQQHTSSMHSASATSATPTQSSLQLQGEFAREVGSVGSSDESPRNSALSAAPAAAGTDGEGGSGVDCEGSEGRNKSTLSDAVIRKLKLKNQQLDKELRDKKRHLEEMTKSVMSWKKNIKDRHVAKIEQVEAILKEKLQRAYNASRKIKVKLIASVCRRHAALTRASVISHWHETAVAAKLKGKLKESSDRCAESELMVAFLKEQLTATGLEPRPLPDGSLLHQQALYASAVLDWLLIQIPSGVIGKYDVDAALAKARATNASGSSGPDGSEMLSKLEMLWAEVRELVASSHKGSEVAGLGSGAGEGGGGGGGHGGKGISNELVIARLRGKVDHLSKMLDAKDKDVTQLQAALQQAKQAPEQKQHLQSAEVEKASIELARANVRIKELQQAMAKANADAEEREVQLKQLTVRVNGQAAALQDKEVQAASLLALQKAVAQLHVTIHELEPVNGPPSTPNSSDPYSSLKAIENMCEQLSLSKRQVREQLSDSQAKLLTVETESTQLAHKMAEMTVAATREKEEAGEVRHELSSLKKTHTETVAQLEAVRKDKGSLQAKAQQMIRDAERVSNLARERALIVEEQKREMDDLRAMVEEAKKQAQHREQHSKAEVDALRGQLQDALAKLEIAEAELAAARKEFEEQRLSLAAASARAEQLAAEAEQLRRTSESDKHQLVRMKDDAEAKLKQTEALLALRNEAQDKTKIDAQMVVLVWVTAELQVLREKHDKQSCRVIELERELAGSNANMRGRGGGKSGASREDKVSADMIASLKQILVYGQDEVELLHQHIDILNERANQAPPESSSPREYGDEATEGGDLEGGRGTHGTGTAKSLEEWRKILAVRSLDGFGTFGIKRPTFTMVGSHGETESTRANTEGPTVLFVTLPSDLACKPVKCWASK